MVELSASGDLIENWVVWEGTWAAGDLTCKERESKRKDSVCILELKYLWEYQGFPGGARGKEPTCQCRRLKGGGFDPWVVKIPWSRPQQRTPVFFPRESHRQRSLASYSPWGRKELDTAEVT